jgi:hypothetical protein
MLSARTACFQAGLPTLYSEDDVCYLSPDDDDDDARDILYYQAPPPTLNSDGELSEDDDSFFHDDGSPSPKSEEHLHHQDDPIFTRAWDYDPENESYKVAADQWASDFDENDLGNAGEKRKAGDIDDNAFEDNGDSKLRKLAAVGMMAMKEGT